MYFYYMMSAHHKFNQVSFLYVVHHGIMPLFVWPGACFVPGGQASFFGLLHTFVHTVMYYYYMMSAMVPQYPQKVQLSLILTRCPPWYHAPLCLAKVS